MKKYSVRLTPAQRQELQQMIATGTEAARKLLHARTLLKADAGEQGPGWTDEQISEALEVSPSTLVRVRRVAARAGTACSPQSPFAQSHTLPTLGWRTRSPFDCPGLFSIAGWARPLEPAPAG